MKTLLIILMTTLLMADAHAHDHEGMMGAPGLNGRDGRDGIDGINGSRFNDEQLVRALSIGAAMTSIPTSSHVDEHNHTSVGTGIGSYAGGVGVAVGITHMQKQMSYKGSIGISGSEAMVGVGASYTFK